MVTDADEWEPEAFALLGELDGLLTKLAATDLTSLSGPQLLGFARDWEQFACRGAVVRHAAVSELDARHAAAGTGHHSTAALLSDLLRINPGEARRRVKDASEFAPRRGMSGEPLPPLLPQVSAALFRGGVGIEHARAISDLFTHIPDQDSDEAELAIEAAAVDVAASCCPHRLTQWCVQAASRLDPDGKAPSSEAKQRQRGVNVVDLPDGWATLTGRLTPYAATALRAVLGPLSAPTPAEDEARDGRTPSQRRHDGLAEACTRLLRSDTLPDSGGAATTILVTIDYRDLLARYHRATHAGTDSGGEVGTGSQVGTYGQVGTGGQVDSSNQIGTGSQVGIEAGRGPGSQPGAGTGSGYGVTSYGSLMSVDEVLRRASDARVIPVILNDAGGVMAYGRGRRLASPAQRRALAARDGGCVRPGCTVPSDWCEVHHVRPWQHGGTTDITHMALVCPHDHDQIDRGASIVMLDGVAHWVEPPYLDPGQTARRNTAHHIPRLFTPPPEPESSEPERNTAGQDP